MLVFVVAMTCRKDRNAKRPEAQLVQTLRASAGASMRRSIMTFVPGATYTGRPWERHTDFECGCSETSTENHLFLVYTVLTYQ